MPNQHRRNPVCFRPPEADRARLRARAERTGESAGSILSAALTAHLDALGEPPASDTEPAPPREDSTP